MRFTRRLLTILGCGFLAALPCPVKAQLAVESPAPEAAAVEFFEKKIRPLLADNCFNCHSASTNSQSGLRVDDRQGLLQGGNRGPAIVPGSPEKSLLLMAVRQTDEKLKMPPKKQLTEVEIADLTKWIADGAAWPSPRVPASLGHPNADYEKLRKEHWAWQPLRSPQIPAVKDANWARDDVDRFLLARLDAQGLAPSGDADKSTLIRRVTFDLTGLPPSPEAVDAFVADAAPDAFEKLVDRLLGSSAFGERWGRHWLDVARYGESSGSARNLPFPHAWRYRDYVIDAFNSDKPYDLFLREQIAGDLLPAASVRQKAEQLVATGFLALGVKDVNQRYKVRFIMDNVDEQIDTVSRAVLGLTASCARCHDHKFDPIPATEYYALAGIFRSSDLCAGVRNKMGGGGLDYYDPQMLLNLGLDEPIPPEETAKKIAQAQADLKQAQAEFEALKGNPEGDVKLPDGRPKRAAARQKMNKLQTQLQALNDPASGGQFAFGVRDAKVVSDTEIRIRGEAEKLGPTVPRGFLSLVQVPDAPQVNTRQSGRLELAFWLTSRQNPLTSRVAVNRIWKHLFGTGLVQSVDNFGVTGDVPSHPELLDHLAERFVQEGWSVKKLVRSLVLSRAYRLSSDAAPANIAADPANRLVWRHAPRRLDAEEIRDAMLSVAGKLDLARPEASPGKEFKVIELRNNGPEAKRLAEQGRASRHRSVYLPLLRGLPPTALEVFDFAEQGMVTGSRETTTVAPQALYMLNDPFVIEQSLTLANRLLELKDVDDSARIHSAYRLALGRSPSTVEIDRARTFLTGYEAAVLELQAQRTEVTAAASDKPDAAPATGEVKDPVVPANPDDPVPAVEPAAPSLIQPGDPRAAAWTSFCQALLGSAEFRFVR